MQGEQFQLVSVIDPGLLSDRMTIEAVMKYRDKRDFADVAAYLDRTKATVFRCREIPGALWSTYVAADGIGDREMWRRAFVCGVQSVVNIVQSSGTRLPEWSPTGTLAGVHGVMTNDECFAKFRPAQWEEIGSVIADRSFFPQGTEHTYRLPPMCLEALARRTFLSADASQTGAATSSGERSESSGVQTGETTTG